MNYLFYDDETTGKHQIIIQIGYILTDENGRELDRFQSLVNPDGERIDRYVTKNIHHISDKDVADAPDFLDVWNEHVAPALKDAVFVAHGAKAADLHHIRKTFAKHGLPMPTFPVIDTYEMAREIPDFKKYGIAVLADHYGIESDNHHDALADSVMLSHVFFEMRSDIAARQEAVGEQLTLDLDGDRPLTVCVTGHRPDKLWGYDLSDAHYDQVRNAFNALIAQLDPTTVISGMALGFDTLVAEETIKTADIALTSAVPFEGQDRRWPLASQKHYRDLLDRADTVVICGGTSRSIARRMQKRNEWMVDHADIVIALWNGTEGGTANCVRYAQRKGKPIYRLDPTTVTATSAPAFTRFGSCFA